jgi:glycosyltransferase involved in cell wall biosynthesis
VHIALTVDPYLPVPPRLYGGIERVVDLLVRELTARGHEVTLFAHPDSRTAGELRGYGAPPHQSRAQRLRELAQVGTGLLTLCGRVDVVHSFGRLAALAPILGVRRLPKIQSYQREIPWRGVCRAVGLGGRSLVFTGCSTSLYAGHHRRPQAGEWRTVFNMVDTRHYQPTTSVAADAPLVFLGRLERIKGPHHAMAIARGAGRRLVLAGNLVTDGPDGDFFDREIRPHLTSDVVEYIGAVDDAQKNALLGRAAALLMPIAWEEPFGIVMAEAAACGTPVIGLRRGSVPEVVREGVSGCICDSIDAAIAAVPRAAALDRSRVRRDCESRFSVDVITSEYERLYEEMSLRCGPRARPQPVVHA